MAPTFVPTLTMTSATATKTKPPSTTTPRREQSRTATPAPESTTQIPRFYFKSLLIQEHLVFVYGTLKRTFPNHHYLHSSTYRGTYRSKEHYPLIVKPPRFSPCLYNYKGDGHRIWGEVWSVDTPTLQKLDKLERVHDEDGYFRNKIHLEGADGENVWCWWKKQGDWRGMGEVVDCYNDRRYRSKGQYEKEQKEKLERSLRVPARRLQIESRKSLEVPVRA